jgi:hypothetical protein
VHSLGCDADFWDGLLILAMDKGLEEEMHIQEEFG